MGRLASHGWCRVFVEKHLTHAVLSPPRISPIHVIVIRGERFGLPVAECLGTLDGPWTNRSAVELPISSESVALPGDTEKACQHSVVVRLERGPTRYLEVGELPFISDEREAKDVSVNVVTFVCRSADVGSVSCYAPGPLDTRLCHAARG